MATKRRPADVIDRILLDQVEKIERMAQFRALSDVEVQFLIDAKKAFSEQQVNDAEVEFIARLNDEELNQFDEAIDKLLKERNSDMN